MSEDNDLKSALEMIGKGYPSFKIEPPRKIIEGDFGNIEEKERPAYIKFSTAFKNRLENISGTALKVWIYISLSVNYDGIAYPGIRTIAKYIGMSHQSVLSAIKELEKLGLLSVNRGVRKFNIYSVSSDYVTIGKGKEPVKKLDSSNVMSQENKSMSQIYTPNESSGLDLNKKEQELNKNKTNSFENKNESTLPSKKSLNHLEKHTLPAGSDLGWMIAAGVKSDEIARQNIDIQNIKEKTDEYERVMGYNPLSWGKKEMINLQKFLAKKSIQDIRRFADWSRKEFSQLSPSKALQFPSLVIELWPQACPVIPERKIEPPKPEPKYAVLDSKEWYKNHPKKEAE
jgi:hypothetical protein